MSSEQKELMSKTLLSFQRALLGMVTPSLRGVTVAISDKQIRCVFFYDCRVDSAMTELVSEVEAEVMADFFPEFEVRAEAKELPLDRVLNRHGLGVWVYARKE